MKKLTDKEKAYIEKNVGKITVEDIAKAMGVPEEEIQSYCDEIGVDYTELREEIEDNKVFLTYEEQAFIQRKAPQHTITEIAKTLGRGYATVRSYCVANNIEWAKAKVKLTEDEKKFIEENRLDMTITEMATALGRLVATIKNHVRTNNLEVKGPTDIEVIRENRHKTAKEIAEMLGKDVTTIRIHCKNHGIEVAPDRNFLTDEQKEYILTHTDKTARELADALGIEDVTQVHQYVRRNKIKIKKSSMKLTEADVKYIYENYKTSTAKEMAEKLGRSTMTIRNYIKQFEK